MWDEIVFLILRQISLKVLMRIPMYILCIVITWKMVWMLQRSVIILSHLVQPYVKIIFMQPNFTQRRVEQLVRKSLKTF